MAEHKRLTEARVLAGLPVSLDDVEAARRRLTGSIVDTDCDWSRTLSDILGCKVWLKFENLQFTASFKERGALNRLVGSFARGEEAGRHRHVGRQPRAGRRLSRASARHSRHHRDAGEHADGEGGEHTAARRRGDPDGRDASRRQRHSPSRTAESAGSTFIHPYDDPLVIAGQGTMALEMLGAAPEIDTFVVPIGGGGLISGIAVAAKALKPDIRMIGVQAELYPSMYNAIKHTALPMRGDTLAEGIAVKAPDSITQADRARAGRRHHPGLRAGDRACRQPVDQHREDRG